MYLSTLTGWRNHEFERGGLVTGPLVPKEFDSFWGDKDGEQ